ncbi:MAG: hypothetical protein ACI3XJ_12705 [Oscillospiraceae bacterium]
MALVAFQKGLRSSLPSTYSEGTFYITTDERAIYLDVDSSTRIRIGDFQEFATLADLQANTNPSTTALYYVTELNVLAKWDGTKYVQINTDTGATSVDVVGTGNAVTAASYNAATRKITLTLGATYTTSTDVEGKIAAKVGALGQNGDGVDYTVKSYVDDKVADVVAGSIDGLGALAAKDVVTDAELDAALKEKIDGKVDSVGAKDASVVIDSTTATTPKIGVQISSDADNALSLASDGLKVVVPDATEYSIVKDTASGDYAAVYHLTKDGTNVGVAINIPKDMVVQSGSVVTDPDGQASGTYIKLILQNVADPLYINVGDLIEYVTSGSSAGDMIVVTVSDDHKVTATITDGSITKAKFEGSVQASLGKADTAVQPSDLTDLENASHTHTNKAELDLIADGDVAKWNAMEQNAKDYSENLLEWGSF